MKLLCKYIGGSHLYGTNTPESDIDERGVFLNEDPLLVYGFRRKDNVVRVNEDEDIALHELTVFLKQATQSGTNILECLFAPRSSFVQLDPMFEQLVLNERFRFLDSNQLYKSLNGYIFNEMRLALGERTGQLGGKRKAALDKYGFSPKNFAHLIRLAWVGTTFFKHGEYVVNIGGTNPSIHDFIMEIKTHPERVHVNDLIKIADAAKADLKDAYENTKVFYEPDFEYIGQVLKHFYSRN